MIKQISIKLKSGSKGGHIIFHFTDKEGTKWVYSRKLQQLILESEMIAGDERLQVKLDSITNASYDIKFNDDPNYKDVKNDMYKKLAELFKYQYQTMVVLRVKADGSYEYGENPNLSVHLFDYIDATQNYVENVITLKRLIHAANIVNQMDTAAMRDTMFHFNYDPTKMKPSEMWMKLINPSDGIVLNRGQFDMIRKNGIDRMRSVLEYFVDDYAKKYSDEDSEIYLKTLCLKALTVQNKATRATALSRKQGGYFINERHVGMELQNVINFLRSNPRERVYLKAFIQEHDEMPMDDIQDLLKQKGFDIDNKAVVYEVAAKEYVKDAAHIQKTHDLDVVRNKYRMRVNDDISQAELEELIMKGKRCMVTWRMHGIDAEWMAKNKEKNFDAIQQWVEDKKAAKREERKKDKKAVVA